MLNIIFICITCIGIYGIYLLKGLFNNSDEYKNRDKDLIEDFYVSMGALYDDEQDIIYSDINAWQREYGYCKVYDKLAWTMLMAVDCEPVYFNYENKLWLIEFWKGQYVVATGCEIGIYVSDEVDGDPEKIFFYSVDDKDMIRMEFVLKRGEEILFQRKERHWWLNGFRFGEFTSLSDLSLDIRLTFNKKGMLTAFTNALKNIGYDDISIDGKSISFEYKKPKFKESLYKKIIINFFVQPINKYLCKKYNELVSGVNNMQDKLELIKEKNIKMYIKIVKAILNRKILYQNRKL